MIPPRLVAAGDEAAHPRRPLQSNRLVAVLCLAFLAATTSTLVANPLHAPPVAGEEHGAFFQSRNLLDEATLALPPLPPAVPPLPLTARREAVTVEPESAPIADTWMWHLGEPALTMPTQGPPPVLPEPSVSVWARLLARAVPILLATGALIALAVLISILPRR